MAPTEKSLSPRQLLFEELRKRQEKNPRYSLRALAHHLELSPGRLSQYMSGQRQITPQALNKICDRLGVAPAVKACMIAQCTRQKTIRQRSAPGDERFYSLNDESTQTSENVFHIIADWEHFALLSLIRLKGLKHDSRSLALRLGLPVPKITAALERLSKANLIIRYRGRLLRTQERIMTSGPVAARALRLSHKQTLERAIASLESVPVELRDVSSITMPISTRKLDEARERIKTFRREMCEFLEGEDADDVYTLSIQLLPATCGGRHNES